MNSLYQFKKNVARKTRRWALEYHGYQIAGYIGQTAMPTYTCVQYTVKKN